MCVCVCLTTILVLGHTSDSSCSVSDVHNILLIQEVLSAPGYRKLIPYISSPSFSRDRRERKVHIAVRPPAKTARSGSRAVKPTCRGKSCDEVLMKSCHLSQFKPLSERLLLFFPLLFSLFKPKRKKKGKSISTSKLFRKFKALSKRWLSEISRKQKEGGKKGGGKCVTSTSPAELDSTRNHNTAKFWDRGQKQGEKRSLLWEVKAGKEKRSEGEREREIKTKKYGDIKM